MNKTDIEKFFDKCAPSWDANMIKSDAKMNEILDFAGVCSGKTVLDVACGTGVMFDYYLERGAGRITGVDLSGNMVAIAQKKYAESDVVSVLKADAENMALGEKYDCCIVFNALPHFCNKAALIQNLKRHINSGGTLTIAHDRGVDELNKHHESVPNSVSCSMINDVDLAALFSECGFSDIRTKSTNDIFIVTGTA